MVSENDVNEPDFGMVDLGASGSGDNLEAEKPVAAALPEDPFALDVIPESTPVPAPESNGEDFGEPLSSATTPLTKLALNKVPQDQVAKPKKPEPKPVPEATAPVANEEIPSESIRAERSGKNRRYEPTPVIGRSYAREFKIMGMALLLLLVIAGGVFGFMKWRESTAAQAQAERDRLNSQSLDSLRDQAVKKDKYGN